MKDQSGDSDIQAVRREEMSRGRRPIDTEQQELARNFKRDFETLLLDGDREQFRAFLIAHGLQDGGEQFQRSMILWEDYQKKRRARF